MTDESSPSGFREDLGRPDVCVSTSSAHLDGLAEDFLDSWKPDGFVIATRRHASLFAGVEWLMPTAVVVYIVHTFFGAALSEAGKDAYKRLKSAATLLYGSAGRLQIARTATPGKIETVPLYSRRFSIVVLTSDELTFKFLIQPSLSGPQAAEALGAFFDLMVALATGTQAPEVRDRLGQAPVMGRTLLVTYDFSLRMIVTVNPLPGPPGKEWKSPVRSRLAFRASHFPILAATRVLLRQIIS